MKKLLLILILIAASAPGARSQNSVPSSLRSSSTQPLTSVRSAQDDPVAKALEQAVNRLAVAEEKNRLLEDRLVAKDEIIKAKDGVISIREEQLRLAQENNKDRGQIISIDSLRLSDCQLQLSKADAEIQRLRYPGLFRSLFDPKVISSGVIGFSLGHVTR